MGSYGDALNVAGTITAKHGLANVPVVAGDGVYDNVAAVGDIVDRLGYQSAALLVRYKTTLNTSETLKLTITLEHGEASNLSDTADYGHGLTATTVATGAVTGGVGVYKHTVPLRMAKRYVRATVTPNLSRANTDTAEIDAVWVLGGANVEPTA